MEDYDYTVRLSRAVATMAVNVCGSCALLGRRVAILYGGAMFACRALGLAYEAQREDEMDASPDGRTPSGIASAGRPAS